jgi:hypothetical protein
MMELFRLRTRGALLGKEVPQDRLGLGTLGIIFCACLTKGTRESHQPILPHDDGAFPTFHLSLSLGQGAALAT